MPWQTRPVEIKHRTLVLSARNFPSGLTWRSSFRQKAIVVIANLAETLHNTSCILRAVSVRNLKVIVVRTSNWSPLQLPRGNIKACTPRPAIQDSSVVHPRSAGQAAPGPTAAVEVSTTSHLQQKRRQTAEVWGLPPWDQPLDFCQIILVAHTRSFT